MKTDDLIEVAQAVERYRQRDDTPPRKRHLAGCVVYMVRAVAESVMPTRGDIENVRLAVCFLCTDRPGHTPAQCGTVVRACPFLLDRMR